MQRGTPRLFEQAWPEGEYRFFQIGFVVDDLVAAAQRWARVFGVGPFHVLPRSETACRYRGADSAIDMQAGVAQAGPVQIELMQQFCDRPSILRDLVAAERNGFHQLCTVTQDYDGVTAHYEALGHPVVAEIEAHGHRVAYVDTIEAFGFVTEVLAHTDEFLARTAKIAETCASWDGTDPVRLLTRDGYRTP